MFIFNLSFKKLLDMKKWSLIIGVFLLTLNLFAQEINERNADSANGSLKVITVYEQPNILSVKSKIRKVISDGYTKYYFDINKGKMYSSIQYENLQSLISSIQKLKSQSELDKDNNLDGVKNMIITPKGFAIGYFMSNGKVKMFFSIGGLNSIRDEDIGEISSFVEDYDAFNYEKDKYGTYIARLSNFTGFEDAFISAKEKIEELKSMD